MINFLEVEATVKELKGQLANGDIDERTLEENLLDLIDVAEDGYYWMFGHESERWYRHDGEQWVLRDPGEMFVALDEFKANGESLTAKWQAVNVTWFVLSLIVLILIMAAVYYSAL